MAVLRILLWHYESIIVLLGATNLLAAEKSTPSPVTVELKHNQGYETSKL